MEVSSKNLLLYGAVGIALYVAYKFLAPVLSAGGTLIDAVGSGITSTEQGIANLWVSLTAAAPMNVQGYAQFPNGSLVALSALTIKQDANGNVYTYSGGITYQMQPWVMSGGQAVYPLVAVGT